MLITSRVVDQRFTVALRTVYRYRLDQRLPFAKLAAEMSAAGCPMPTRTLIDLFAFAAAKDAGHAWTRHRPGARTKYHLVKFHFHLKEHRDRRLAMRRRRRASVPPAIATAADHLPIQ